MYAVIETGNKQYKVFPGDIMDVELIEAKDKAAISNVLLLADGDNIEIGTPYVKGAEVIVKVLANLKDAKVTTFKYKNKTNYHRTIGHRQNYTRVQVEEIKHGS